MRIGKCLSMTATALAVTAMTGGAAWAQATPEGAAEIRDGLKAWIVETLSFSDIPLSLVFDGAIEVTQTGDIYGVSIPPSTLTIPDYQPILVQIGTIAVELVPYGEHRYITNWTLPDTYVIGPADGSDQATVTIGVQSGNGTLDTRYGTFLDFDLVWSDIELLPPDNEGVFRIGRLALESWHTELGSEVYNFTFGGTLEDLYFTETRSGDEVSIGQIGLEGFMEQVNLPAYMAFGEELNALVAGIQQAEQSGADPSALVEQFAGTVESSPALFDAGEFRYFADGGRFAIDGEVVEFAGGAMTIGAYGLAGPLGEITLDYQQGQVTMAPAPPFAEAIPEHVGFGLSLTDLPNETIVNSLVEALRGLPTMGPEGAMMMALAPLQQAAIENASAFHVEYLEIDNPNYAVDLNGSVELSASSPFGAVLEAGLLVGRVEALTEMVARLSPDPEASAALAALVAAGQVDEGADGDPRRRYDIEITGDGQMLLNGADMQPLLGQIMQ